MGETSIHGRLSAGFVPRENDLMKVFVGIRAGYEHESFVFPFAKTFIDELDRRGIAWTHDPDEPCDVALLVQWATDEQTVARMKARGTVIVHRLDGRARALVKVYDNDEVNRRINRLADWTVFQARYVREHTVNECGTIFGVEAPIVQNPQRASLIYNGVDRSVFSDTGPIEPLAGEVRVLHVAFSMGTRKGVPDLYKAANLLKNNPAIRFYTIGRQNLDLTHGPLLANLPNVTHLGVIVDRERLASIMRSCDVLFFPSYGDYCPNTVLEGMSCGLPVWYHDSGGTPELVRDEVTIAGVPMMPENPVYPLYVLLEHKQEMSRRAVEMVRRRFTAERMVDDYLALFERLLAERRVPVGSVSA